MLAGKKEDGLSFVKLDLTYGTPVEKEAESTQHVRKIISIVSARVCVFE